MLLTVLLPMVTEIFPVVEPAGTVTINWFSVADLTIAFVPLKLTTSFVLSGSKCVPVMVTNESILADRGLKPDITCYTGSFVFGSEGESVLAQARKKTNRSSTVNFLKTIKGIKMLLALQFF